MQIASRLTNWEQIFANPEPMRFTALADGSTVQMAVPTNSGALSSLPPESIDLIYSKDGAVWEKFIPGTTVVELSTGQTCYLKAGETGNQKFSYNAQNLLSAGSNVNYSRYNATQCYTLKPTGRVAVAGSVQSLFGQIEPILPGRSLFYNCSALVDASQLILPRCGVRGCVQMFLSCSNLSSAPIIETDGLAKDTYYQAFRNCSSLVEVPELRPFTQAGARCFCYMFSNCTKLEHMPANYLPATTLADSCYSNMFSGCSSLTAAPELPATTLAVSCYSNMFSGCSSLTAAPELPVDLSVLSCGSSLSGWLSGNAFIPRFDHVKEILALVFGQKEKGIAKFKSAGDFEEMFPVLERIQSNNQYYGVFGDDAFTELSGKQCFSNVKYGLEVLSAKNLVDLSAPNLIVGGRHLVYGCASLSSVHFPTLVSCNTDYYGSYHLGLRFFTGCSSLPEIDLPEFDFAAHVENRDSAEKMFSACASLSNVNFKTYPISADDWSLDNFMNACGLSDYAAQKMLSSVEYLKSQQYVFANCKNLTKNPFVNVKTAGPGNVGMFANSGVSSVVWPSLSCLDLRTNAYAYPNVYYFTIFYSREYNPTDVYFPVLQSVMLSSGKEAEIVVQSDVDAVSSWCNLHFASKHKDYIKSVPGFSSRFGAYISAKVFWGEYDDDGNLVSETEGSWDEK